MYILYVNSTYYGYEEGICASMSFRHTKGKHECLHCHLGVGQTLDVVKSGKCKEGQGVPMEAGETYHKYQ